MNCESAGFCASHPCRLRSLRARACSAGLPPATAPATARPALLLSLVLVGKSRAFFGAKRRRRLPKSPLESIAWTAGSTTLLVHGTWML